MLFYVILDVSDGVRPTPYVVSNKPGVEEEFHPTQTCGQPTTKSAPSSPPNKHRHHHQHR